jgi:hypothetical protein
VLFLAVLSNLSAIEFCDKNIDTSYQKLLELEQEAKDCNNNIFSKFKNKIDTMSTLELLDLANKELKALKEGQNTCAGALNKLRAIGETKRCERFEAKYNRYVNSDYRDTRSLKYLFFVYGNYPKAQLGILEDVKNRGFLPIEHKKYPNIFGIYVKEKEKTLYIGYAYVDGVDGKVLLTQKKFKGETTTESNRVYITQSDKERKPYELYGNKKNIDNIVVINNYRKFVIPTKGFKNDDSIAAMANEIEFHLFPNRQKEAKEFLERVEINIECDNCNKEDIKVMNIAPAMKNMNPKFHLRRGVYKFKLEDTSEAIEINGGDKTVNFEVEQPKQQIETVASNENRETASVPNTTPTPAEQQSEAKTITVYCGNKESGISRSFHLNNYQKFQKKYIGKGKDGKMISKKEWKSGDKTCRASNEQDGEVYIVVEGLEK